MGYNANGQYVPDTLASPDLYNIGADVQQPAFAGGPMNVPGPGGFGAPTDRLGQLSTISGYQKWGAGLPANAGFGSKLGSWMTGNGQMIGGFANALSSGVQAYVGLKQLGLAQDAFDFEKKAFKTNLRNSVQSYNTQMQDRLTGRYYATDAERQAALKEAELSDSMNKKGG